MRLFSSVTFEETNFFFRNISNDWRLIERRVNGRKTSSLMVFSQWSIDCLLPSIWDERRSFWFDSWLFDCFHSGRMFNKEIFHDEWISIDSFSICSLSSKTISSVQLFLSGTFVTSSLYHFGLSKSSLRRLSRPMSIFIKRKTEQTIILTLSSSSSHTLSHTHTLSLEQTNDWPIQANVLQATMVSL